MLRIKVRVAEVILSFKSQNSGKLMLVETSVSSWLLLYGQSHFWTENFWDFFNISVRDLDIERVQNPGYCLQY